MLRAREATPALSAEHDRYLGTYYPLYKAGHLLTKGGVSDQPARYLDYMVAIRDAEDTVQRKFDEVTGLEEDDE